MKAVKKIEIYKDLLPYQFDFEVQGKVWTFKLKPHRLYKDKIRVDVINEEGITVLENQVCIQNRPIGYQYLQDDQGNANLDLPQAFFTFVSIDKSEYQINVDTIEKDVFLTVQDVV